jgi:pimeloyl-ACP methyl ester carboxylesterase
MALRKYSQTIFGTAKIYSSSYSLKSVKMKDVDGSEKLMYLTDVNQTIDGIPILFLGGTAQTIGSFSPHFKSFSKSNRLIVPELRGQGQTTLSAEFGNMGQQIEDLVRLLDHLGLEKINLCGFSFGGRVALAFAAHKPSFVHKLSLSGVPLSRNALGKVILHSWMDSLSRGNMRDCAWSFLINGYSPAFMEKYRSQLDTFVDIIVKGNDATKLHALLRSNHNAGGSSVEDPYSAARCASIIRCPTQIIGFSEDRIAAVGQVRELAAAIPNSPMLVEMSACGHLGLYENSLVWRKHVLDFLNAS